MGMEREKTKRERRKGERGGRLRCRGRWVDGDGCAGGIRRNAVLIF